MSYSKVRTVSVLLDGTDAARNVATQAQGEKGFRITNPCLPSEEGGSGQHVYVKVHPAATTGPTLAQMQAGDVTAILWPGQLFTIECLGQSFTCEVDSGTLGVKVEVLS